MNCSRNFTNSKCMREAEEGYKECSSCRRSRAKYFMQNKILIRARHREWSAQNKNKIRGYRNKELELFRSYMNRHCSPWHRARMHMSQRMNKILKDNLADNACNNLLGCSVNYFRGHIEKQFSTGMSWKNYGMWHIDHILPCKSFDLTKAEQQKRCFHYKNLQPLWASDNARKGAKSATTGLSHLQD